MDKKTQNYIDRLAKHRDLSNSRAEYAMKRLDIVIIALSSSGLLLCFNHLKNHPDQNDPMWIPIVFFVLAILINIVSQWCGYYANQNEYAWAEAEINKEKEQSEAKIEEAKELIVNDCSRQGDRSLRLTKWTNGTNIAASISLGMAIIILVILFIF